MRGSSRTNRLRIAAFPLRAQQFPLSYSLSIMPKTNHDIALLAVARRVRPSGRLWNPAADVYRSPDGWLVKVDLAGVQPSDLQIELLPSSLKIRGCRRDTVVRDGFTYQQMEITYSQFEKTIQFPCALEETTIDHDYRDGFLIVHVQCK